MREDVNPAKEAAPLPAYGRHRVVVPVHIPSLEGYFAHALSILELCLESLRRTASGRVAVSLVSDGSCDEARSRLAAAQEAGWVDQVVVQQPNRGKVDSVLSVARGSFEELVTVADADVLFREGWVEAVEALFEAFPECGYASLFPSPPGMYNYTSATLLGALVGRATHWGSVVDDDDLDRFATSIGRDGLYPEHHRRVQLLLERDGVIASVGAPHFVLTLRREVLEAVPAEAALDPVGRSETRWLDEPADRMGLWRLSTAGAFAQHMGNVPEPWMHEELAALPDPPAAVVPRERPPLPRARVHAIGRVPWRWRAIFTDRVLRPLLERRIRARARRA